MFIFGEMKNEMMSKKMDNLTLRQVNNIDPNKNNESKVNRFKKKKLAKITINTDEMVIIVLRIDARENHKLNILLEVKLD